MSTQKVVDDLTAGVEEEEGGEELVEEENNDECSELTRGELAEEGEEEGEDEVEGGEGGDRPGGEGKGALSSGCGYHMLVIVSVSTHLEYARTSFAVMLMDKHLRVVTGPGPGQPKRARMFEKRNIG